MANPVTISNLEAILKDFYMGPIIEALNNQLEMIDLFKKITVDWSGRKVVIPVHVDRNTGTAYKGEGSDLPVAGGQGHVDLSITAKYLYGRFMLTGPAIASAKTTANSFATYVQTEMDGLVTDTKIRANQAMFTGGGAIGFITEKHSLGAGGTNDYPFSGNKDVAQSLLALVPASNRLEVDIIRLDTYQSVVVRPTAADHILADPAVLGTGALRIHSFGNATADTSGIVGDYAAMVVVRSVPEAAGATVGGFSGVFTEGPPDTYVTDATSGVKTAVEAEALGLYANLGEVNHFGVARSTASNAPLRSTIQAVADNAALQTLSFKRMQGILDEIMVLGGDDPDCIYVHPGIRQEYSALLAYTASGTLQKDVQAGAKKGDPGFSGYSFNNIPLKMSRHCGKGLMVFLNTKVWCITELKSFGMADMDGNVLNRVTNRDEWEGFVSWYYNLVCKEPNRCAILAGIDFPGA